MTEKAEHIVTEKAKEFIRGNLFSLDLPFAKYIMILKHTEKRQDNTLRTHIFKVSLMYSYTYEDRDLMIKVYDVVEISKKEYLSFIHGNPDTIHLY